MSRKRKTQAERYATLLDRVEATKARLDATGHQRLVRLPEVLALTSLSRPTLYKLMAAGRFPRPVKINPRCVAWPLAAVQKHVAALIATAA